MENILLYCPECREYKMHVKTNDGFMCRYCDNVQPCPHRWNFKTPNGETSPGYCKWCGATFVMPEKVVAESK